MRKKSAEIGAWLLAMMLAGWIAARFWSTAFPIAAVRFPLTRAEETGRMEAFLQGMGMKLEGYRGAVEFGETEETKNFIEREYGPERLAAAAKAGVDVWYWEGRWFKPEQHEEYQAWTDQEGRLAGYRHVIEEERALPSLSGTQARQLAEDFLRKHVTQYPVEGLKFIETRREEKPRRTDYGMIWEVPGLKVGAAPYQLNVTVQGNEVGEYGEYLKVPEWWRVKYERERAVNKACYNAATLAAGGLVVWLVIVFLIAVRNGAVRWRDAVPWQWMLVFGLVAALTRINGAPAVVFGYPTTQAWGPFVAGAILEGVRGVVWEVVGFWLLVVLADCVYRQRLPGRTTFRRALGAEGLGDAGTVRALGVGIAFAVFALAYVCVFYTVGKRWGVWCPVEVDYTKTLSGFAPWVEAMHTGLTASFTEEMLFRVGVLLLIWRVVRVRWVALVLAAAAWAFLHSNYPQTPGYVRGIELTIVGIAWGAVMLRYGVVATLTAHYLYDCWMECLFGMHGAGAWNAVGTAVAALWPVGLFLWGVTRRGPALEPERADEPRAEPGPAPMVAAKEWRYAPLGLAGWRGVAVLAASAGMITLVFVVRMPQETLGRLGVLDLSRAEILKKADAALEAHGYSPAGYERVTTVEGHWLPAKYLLEHGTLDALAGLYEREFRDLTWHVRYFRFLEPEEFGETLDAHGNELSWSHKVLREAPGPALDEAAALARAKAAMGSWIDVSRQEPVQVSPMQQENRRDWGFAFDEKGFGWGDAKLRTQVRVQGGEAVNLMRYVKVPDAWLLQHAKSGWEELIVGETRRWTQIATNVLVGTLLMLLIRKQLAGWRRGFVWALVPAGAEVVKRLNEAQQFYAGYDTSLPRANYLGNQLGQAVLEVAMTYLGAVLLIAMALGFVRWAWGWTPEQWRPWRGEERGVYWRETAVTAVAGVAAIWALATIHMELLGLVRNAMAAEFRYWNVTEWAAWLGALTEAIPAGYHEVVRLAITVSVLKLVWDRHRWLAVVLLLAGPVLEIPAEGRLEDFAWALGYAEAWRLLALVLVVKVWRFNWPAAFLAFAGASLGHSIHLLLAKGGAGYRMEAVPLLALLVAVLAWCWFGGGGRKRVEGPTRMPPLTG